MNRQELFQKAKQLIERRRQAVETKAISDKEKIYLKVPELAILDKQKTEAGVMAARFAADGQGELAAEKLELVHQIGHRRQILLGQHGFLEKDLEPDYVCKTCNDTGRLGNKSCHCVQEEVRRLRRIEVNEAGPLSLSRFENFSLDYYPQNLAESPVSPRDAMNGILLDCKEYAKEFGLRSESLFMFGNAGLGKTHLALSIASEVLEKGYDVIYVSAQSAFSEISNERFTSGGGALFESMMDADLLIVDDLGTEYLDAYTMGRLYELVNGRMRRPTIYTTNISKQDLLYQRYTEKIASRLLGECHLMRFWGKDIRLQK